VEVGSSLAVRVRAAALRDAKSATAVADHGLTVTVAHRVHRSDATEISATNDPVLRGVARDMTWIGATRGPVAQEY
jgi:hypothetical protein